MSVQQSKCLTSLVAKRSSQNGWHQVRRFFVKKTLVKEMLLIITNIVPLFNVEVDAGTIAENIYKFVDVNDKQPVEQKGYARKKVEGPMINY